LNAALDYFGARMSNSIATKLFSLGKNLLIIACKNPGGLKPVLGHALAETAYHLDRQRDMARLPGVPLEQLLDADAKPIEPVSHLFPLVAQSVSFIEAVSLGVLLRKCEARRVFEFGTHRGVSTAQLALNVGEGGRVFTLDLPRTDPRTKFDLKCASDLEISRQAQKADLIPEHCRAQITFLEQDSATFDEKPYAGTMDAVFVDGAHTYEYVRNDSEKGWRMLRPGGVIIWHDFRPHTPDVMRYLFETDFKPSRIEGTTLAFAVKPRA
jgi:predicted O-methyltransferase YrrM